MTREKTCVVCGKNFLSECPCAKYCSDECRKKALKARNYRNYLLCMIDPEKRAAHNAYQRQYRLEHAEELRQKRRAYYEKSLLKALRGDK